MQLEQATSSEFGPNTWLKVFSAKDGHRYFRNLKTNQVSICDNSGAYPHLTDDGVLYLDHSRSIVIGDERATIPVLRADGSQANASERPHDALRVAWEFGLDIEVVGRQAAFVRELFRVMSGGVRVTVAPEK